MSKESGGAGAAEEPELKTNRMQDPVTSADPVLKDDRVARISSAIRVIHDFPKPGIMFQDITTLLLDAKAFKVTNYLFVERYKDKNIIVVAGIEARGFIFWSSHCIGYWSKIRPHEETLEVAWRGYFRRVFLGVWNRQDGDACRCCASR